MSIPTLLKYLLGDRHAILTVASTRGVLALGLLFVLSAGLAREYDGEDLLSEPWHLLLPLAASVVSSFVLFLVIWCVAWLRSVRDLPFLSSYLTFLGLYWMMAPMAWAYAVPYERFLSAGNATRMNLLTLAAVSLWRVLLMSRVIAVLLMVVMLFASAVTIALLNYTPLPVISIMGGVRLTESERVIAEIAFMLQILTPLALPVWLIAGLIALFSSPQWQRQFGVDTPNGRVTGPLWCVSVIALCIWAPILPATQREQQMRRLVERQLRGGQIREALEEMSRHPAGDFPPHWDPPPKPGYGEKTPTISQVIEQLKAGGAAPHVRALFIEKLRRQMESDLAPLFWVKPDLPMYLQLLARLPEGPELLRPHRERLKDILRFNDELSEEHRAAAKALLQIAEQEAESPASSHRPISLVD
jgi:hypothetical protein